MAKSKKARKYVYFFGGGKADGNESMKNLLGGKGANLAEMAGHRDLRLPVPPGFTITTEVCTYYYENKKKYPKELEAQVSAALSKVEKIMGKKFGDVKDPLLLSVRSGARRSMPGMMDTVLNIGLNDATVLGLIDRTKNPRFAYDAYRRLIMMYSDVVMEKAEGIEPKGGKGIRKILDERLDAVKKKKGYTRTQALKTITELAHNENLTELAQQINNFLIDNLHSTADSESIKLDRLVNSWQNYNQEKKEDKVGVFWALLLLSSQSKVELYQEEFYQDLDIRIIGY